MAAEMPLVGAALTRLPASELQLYALGSVVYPLCLVVEGPVIMLLAAGAKLGKDRHGYDLLWRFAHGSGLVLTLVHAVLAFTPVLDHVALGLLAAKPGSLEAAREGMQWMLPWTWAIAARRFAQGVVIRQGRSRIVGAGTVVRLAVNAGVLGLGLLVPWGQGIAVAGAAISAGVLAEAVFTAWAARPVVRRLPERDGEVLGWGAFLRFYLPLACTPLVTLLIQPIGAAAMNRMPDPKVSLAAWPVVYGLVFVTRSAGFAYNEVAVSLIQEDGGRVAVRRFAVGLALAMMGVLALLAFTPFSALYFERFTRLEGDLLDTAVGAVGLAVLMPGYAVIQNYFQGALVGHGASLPVSLSVLLYAVVASVLLAAGVWWQGAMGIQVAIVAFTIAGLAQTAFLWRRWARVASRWRPRAATR